MPGEDGGRGQEGPGGVRRDALVVRERLRMVPEERAEIAQVVARIARRAELGQHRVLPDRGEHPVGPELRGRRDVGVARGDEREARGEDVALGRRGAGGADELEPEMIHLPAKRQGQGEIGGNDVQIPEEFKVQGPMFNAGGARPGSFPRSLALNLER